MQSSAISSLRPTKLSASAPEFKPLERSTPCPGQGARALEVNTLPGGGRRYLKPEISDAIAKSDNPAIAKAMLAVADAVSDAYHFANIYNTMPEITLVIRMFLKTIRTQEQLIHRLTLNLPIAEVDKLPFENLSNKGLLTALKSITRLIFKALVSSSDEEYWSDASRLTHVCRPLCEQMSCWLFATIGKDMAPSTEYFLCVLPEPPAYRPTPLWPSSFDPCY
jgi:hypothetical protein